MTRKEAAVFGGLEYAKDLRREFGPNSPNVDHVLYGRKQAPVLERTEETVPYVHLRAETPESDDELQQKAPILYVPGFTEGVVAKAPLGLALTELGHDVILPDQNRKGVLRDADGKKNATFTQATHLLSIIEAENLTESRVDFVTHSYGSTVLEKMVEEADKRGWTCFEDANVAMLTPAGLREEKLLSFAKRFAKDIMSTGSSEKLIDDHAFKYGFKNLISNLPRSIREVFEMKRRKIDFDRMKNLGKIASLHVFSHAEDKIFPSSITEQTPEVDDTLVGSSIRESIENGSIDGWSVPVDVASVASKEFSYSGQHAEHNDEQFYPRRSARAIDQVLSAKIDSNA